ncbi:hypothetical protein [Enterococcus sp.]|uniref:hypothetical protein n=1 Tax=Enterococcus sp. TaxID=35783 RepID=UPI002896E69E|nr:hypothetical protein [Enterococcus sp.]
MFIDYPEKRQRITLSLRKEISALRAKKGYSTNFFATSILNKSQSWLAQIEGGKIKTISNADLVDLFEKLLSVSSDEVEVYLTDNYDRLFTDELSNIEESSFNDSEKDKKISYFKAKPVKSEDENRKLYKKYINNLDEGLMIFFDNVDNKNDALNILQNIVENLHQDMGFTLSIAALPLGAMRDADVEEKKAVFFEIIEVLKKHGKLQFDEDEANSDE